MIPKFIDAAIDIALSMLPSKMDTIEARLMLNAIGLQESAFEHKFQVVQGKPGAKGPARGYWQFERGGGARGVARHPASRYWMHHLCTERGVEFSSPAIWKAIEEDTILAAGAARLLLFTDPKRLPAINDVNGAWALYERVWRPGKPHPDKWPANYAEAFMRVRV